MENNKQEMVKKEVQKTHYIELTNYDNALIEKRLKAIDSIGDTIKKALIEGIDNDYAVIPGTSKPSLLQPGARKICMLYGLVAEYFNEKIVTIKDANKKDVECVCVDCHLITPQGVKISENSGSATIEILKINKYGIATPKEPGWALNAARKLAKKRALVGAVMGVANLSKVFTQDTEDMNILENKTKDTKQKNIVVNVDLNNWSKNK